MKRSQDKLRAHKMGRLLLGYSADTVVSVDMEKIRQRQASVLSRLHARLLLSTWFFNWYGGIREAMLDTSASALHAQAELAVRLGSRQVFEAKSLAKSFLRILLSERDSLQMLRILARWWQSVARERLAGSDEREMSAHRALHQARQTEKMLSECSAKMELVMTRCLQRHHCRLCAQNHLTSWQKHVHTISFHPTWLLYHMVAAWRVCTREQSSSRRVSRAIITLSSRQQRRRLLKTMLQHWTHAVWSSKQMQAEEEGTTMHLLRQQVAQLRQELALVRSGSQQSVAAAVERSLKADLRCSQMMEQAQALQLDLAASQAHRQKADSLLADIVGQLDAAGTGLVLAGDGDCSDPALRVRALMQTVQRSRMEATAGAVGLEAWLESAEGLVLALEQHHAQLSLAAHNALQQMQSRRSSQALAALEKQTSAGAEVQRLEAEHARRLDDVARERHAMARLLSDTQHELVRSEAAVADLTLTHTETLQASADLVERLTAQAADKRHLQIDLQHQRTTVGVLQESLREAEQERRRECERLSEDLRHMTKQRDDLQHQLIQLQMMPSNLSSQTRAPSQGPQAEATASATLTLAAVEEALVASVANVPRDQLEKELADETRRRQASEALLHQCEETNAWLRRHLAAAFAAEHHHAPPPSIQQGQSQASDDKREKPWLSPSGHAAVSPTLSALLDAGEQEHAQLQQLVADLRADASRREVRVQELEAQVSALNAQLVTQGVCRLPRKQSTRSATASVNASGTGCNETAESFDPELLQFESHIVSPLRDGAAVAENLSLFANAVEMSSSPCSSFLISTAMLGQQPGAKQAQRGCGVGQKELVEEKTMLFADNELLLDKNKRLEAYVTRLQDELACVYHSLARVMKQLFFLRWSLVPSTRGQGAR